MNNFSKTLMILGFALMVISLAFTKFNLQKIYQPLIDQNNEKYTFKEKNIIPSEDFKIILNSSNQNISIVATERSDIHIEYYDADDDYYEFTETDNSITIKNKVKIRWFDFTFFSPNIRIEVPIDFFINYDVSSSNGSIEIFGTGLPGMDLSLNESKFKTSNGKIISKNLFSNEKIELVTSNSRIEVINSDINDIYVKTSNGTIEFKNSKADIINGKTSNSKIIIDHVETSNYINFETSNGRIELNSLNAKDIKLKTSNAKIEGSIIGDYDDFDKDIKTSNGRIYVNETEYSNKINSNNSKENKLNIKTSNSKINLEFIKKADL